MLLSELLSAFLQDRTRRCVPRIVEWYRSHLSLFIAWLFEHETIRADLVTREQIDRYIVDLQTRECMNRVGKLSPVTIQKRITAMKTFFSWAVEIGELASDPSESVVVPRRGQRLPKALTSVHVAQLLSVELSARDRAVLFLLLDSGLRLSELAALDALDIDIVRGLVHVRHGKGDKERWSVFGARTRIALEAWMLERVRMNGHSPRLFVGKRGSLTAMGCYKLIKRVGKRAGLFAVVAPHKLRHTFATMYLDGGGSPFDLKELLGHTDIRTTMVYVSVSLERLRQKHEMLSPISRLAIG